MPHGSWPTGIAGCVGQSGPVRVGRQPPERKARAPLGSSTTLDIRHTDQLERQNFLLGTAEPPGVTMGSVERVAGQQATIRALSGDVKPLVDRRHRQSSHQQLPEHLTRLRRASPEQIANIGRSAVEIPGEPVGIHTGGTVGLAEGRQLTRP